MRCAIYFVPPPDDALSIAAAKWLRRDAYTGARISTAIDGLTEDDHAFLTALPRRYGFHATLKPSFRMACGKTIYELERQLDAFCARALPIMIEVRLALVKNFFALTAASSAPELDSLAARVVTEFDSFRDMPSEAEIARRDVSRLTRQQLTNLVNWGAPNVFGEFRFHMTLTGPIDHLERDHVGMVLERHFAECGSGHLEISQLVLAVEPELHAPFLIHSVHSFAAEGERRIA